MALTLEDFKIEKRMFDTQLKYVVLKKEIVRKQFLGLFEYGIPYIEWYICGEPRWIGGGIEGMYITEPFIFNLLEEAQKYINDRIEIGK